MQSLHVRVIFLATGEMERNKLESRKRCEEVF